MVNNDSDKTYSYKNEIQADFAKYRNQEKYAKSNAYYIEHVKALREAVDDIKPMMDYIVLETKEINLQKAQYDSINRVINYCYGLIPYLSKESEDIKDCTKALDKISNFFQTYQTNNNDICTVAEPVIEYKTKDSDDVSESISIDKHNNISSPTIKMSLETGLTLIGLLLSFVTIILDIYFHEVDSKENKEPKTEININIEEQNIEIQDIHDLIDTGEYLQKIIEQIHENHQELFMDM